MHLNITFVDLVVTQRVCVGGEYQSPYRKLGSLVDCVLTDGAELRVLNTTAPPVVLDSISFPSPLNLV
jgi:hypothetical protein